MAIWSYLRGSDTLDIKVGYKCNNNCLHCVVKPVRDEISRQKNPLNLTTDQIICLINKAQAMQLSKVVLTGGEVTTREDFLKILEAASSKGLEILLQTNGRKLSDNNLLEKIRGIPNILFIIAIHGHNAGIHDKITRRIGSFQQTLEGLKKLKEQNRPIVCKMVITRLNAHDIYNTATLALELGVNEFSVVFPHMPNCRPSKYCNLIPRYSSLENQLEVTALLSHERGFWIDFETIPFCVCTSSEVFWLRNCDMISRSRIRETAKEEKTISNSNELEWESLRPTMKSKRDICVYCVFDRICEGVWAEYGEFFGLEELKPITPRMIEGQLTCKQLK